MKRLNRFPFKKYSYPLKEASGQENIEDLINDIEEVGRSYHKLVLTVYNSSNPSEKNRMITYFIDSSLGVEVYDDKILIETRSGDIWLNTKNIVKIDNNSTSISGKASYKSLFTDVILKDGMYKFRFDEK